MNCEDFRVAFLSGDSDVDDDFHLASCATCRKLVDRLTVVRSALEDPSVWEEPPPELADRVAGLLPARQEPAAPAAPAAAADAAGTPPRRRWWMMVAAVIVAFLVGMGVMTARMNRPDWEVAMPGTELAPDAMATVQGWRVNEGTRLVMTVEGLDPAPPGHHYEFWLSNEEEHISAGTFVAGNRVEMTSAVGRRNYPRLWVTIEAADGDSSPSWVTVLDTKVE